MPAPAAPVLTATPLVDDGYVRLHVELDGTATELDIHRTGPSGVRAYVRGVQGRNVTGFDTDDHADYEIPFGVAVDYVAVARNVDGETESATVTVELDVDDDWLVDLDDARNTGPVLVESLAELEYDAPQGVHRVIGRRTPIVTSDLRWTPSGQLVLVTLTAEEARRVRDALGSSSPLLLRSRLERGVGNMYLLATNVRERRVSRIATAPERRWHVDVVEIDRPDATLYSPIAVTWGEIVGTFATWQDLLDGRPTWADVVFDRTGISGADVYSRELAFPPRDV